MFDYIALAFNVINILIFIGFVYVAMQDKYLKRYQELITAILALTIVLATNLFIIMFIVNALTLIFH
jgi:hypothetical protein